MWLIDCRNQNSSVLKVIVHREHGGIIDSANEAGFTPASSQAGRG